MALEPRDLGAITPDGARRRSRATTATTAGRRCELRDWLERLRAADRAAGGTTVPRPPLEGDEPTGGRRASGKQRVDALRDALLDGVPVEPAERTPEQQARWLLAYLLDWHRREDKVGVVGVLPAAASCRTTSCSTSRRRSPGWSSSSASTVIGQEAASRPGR